MEDETEDEFEEEEVNQFLLRGITQEEMTLNLQYQERLRLAWQVFATRPISPLEWNSPKHEEKSDAGE